MKLKFRVCSGYMCTKKGVCERNRQHIENVDNNKHKDAEYVDAKHCIKNNHNNFVELSEKHA